MAANISLWCGDKLSSDSDKKGATGSVLWSVFDNPQRKLFM